jgi:hypothetical protein
MKNLKMNKFMGIMAAVLFSMSALAADPVIKYQGRFEIQPKVMHPDAIAGSTTVFHNAAGVSSVEQDTDTRVMGRTHFVSSEQSTTTAATTEQVFYVYKIARSPHKWNFVLMIKPSKGGPVHDAVYYRVDAEKTEVLETCKGGIDEEHLPANWKSVGKGTMELK